MKVKTGENDVRMMGDYEDDNDESHVQSDTVVFERDNSSLVGTPPKIA